MTAAAPKNKHSVKIIGIDPGLTGAVACVDLEAERLDAIYDMPYMAKNNSSAWVKREVDAESLVQMIKSMHDECIRLGGKGVGAVVIEEVASRPAQGVASVFSFGHSFGVAIGAAACLYPTSKTIRISPTVWKAHFGLNWSKKLSLALAIEKFGHKEAFRSLKQHGRAEAALIALYGIKAYKQLRPNDAKHEVI